MKKIVFSALLGFSGIIYSEENQQVNQLLSNLEEVHKVCNDYGIKWMRYSQKFMNEKYHQIIRGHEARAQLHHWFMGELKKDGLTENLLREKLNKAIDLHETIMNEWEHLAHKYQEKAQKLMLKERQAFDAARAHIQ